MDLAESGPLRPLLLPAVQHQLMEMWGAVNRSREPETVLDGLDHLQDAEKKEDECVRLENFNVINSQKATMRGGGGVNKNATIVWPT